MVRKKRIKEFDEFDWVKDINPEYNIENIISKKIHWRHNNLGELEDLGHDLTTIDKSKVILGKIRWTDYFVVEGIDSKTNEALVQLYPNKYKSEPLSYPIDEVENLVRIGVWVVMGDDGKILNESEDFDWVKETPEVIIGGKNGLPKESVPLGTKVVNSNGDIFTIEEFAGWHMNFQHVWGSDQKIAWLGPKDDEDNKNWHNALWLRRATPKDLNESEGEWDWVNDTTPMELMDPQSFVGKSFGYGDRVIKRFQKDNNLTSFHDKEYFTIESIDGNGNLALTKHHPIYGESHGYAATIKNLIEFINNGSWVWI
jgi:hypothetical protein